MSGADDLTQRLAGLSPAKRLLLSRWQQGAVRKAPAPSPGRDSEATQVTSWQLIFDDFYGRPPLSDDPGFNTSGWISSFTGKPISDPEMREWVENTVVRLRELAPRRVLEVGCGTGLLLAHLAPSAERYVGMDFSHSALVCLERLRAGRPELAHVELALRAADDLTDFAAAEFDLVILNSVAQYFPGADYLLAVVDGCARVAAPGACLFFGDLRSLPLLPAFAAAVELERAPDDLPVADWRERVQRRINEERELLLHPALFLALRSRIPAPCSVFLLLKRGFGRNEMARYRYDAVLRLGGDDPPPEIEWLDWCADRLSLEALCERLARNGHEQLAIRGVPDARVAAELRALELAASGEEANMGALRRRAVAESRQAVDPEDLWQLAGELPFRLDLLLDPSGAPGRFNAVFRRRNGGREPGLDGLPCPAGDPSAEGTPWTSFINTPLEQPGRRAGEDDHA